jgi:hypothetical protein
MKAAAINESALKRMPLVGNVIGPGTWICLSAALKSI